VPGSDDGVGRAARFFFPSGIVPDGAGNLIIVDLGNATVRKLALATLEVTTLAGAAPVLGSADGAGAAARFDGPPAGLLSDGAGNLYAIDGANNRTIRKIEIATGAVTTLVGTAGASGFADGTGPDARFDTPAGLAADGAGNIYVTDLNQQTIRRIVLATGEVTTFAGVHGELGHVDGVGAAARFNTPQGIASDGAGNLYVADSGNAVIRKIEVASGNVTTIAGISGVGAVVDGVGLGAEFGFPIGITSDRAGNLYVGDTNTVRRIVLASGQVTTVAGSPGASGATDGSGPAARFGVVFDLAHDGATTLYVSDGEHHTIRKLNTATGVVSTAIGRSDRAGVLPGPLPASLNAPTTLEVLPDGRLALSDESSILIASF
jgi:sugar lactone lactonase YvrE